MGDSDNDVLYEVRIELGDALANVDKLLKRLQEIEKFGKSSFAQAAKEITEAAKAMDKLSQSARGNADANRRTTDTYNQLRDSLRVLRGEQRREEQENRRAVADQRRRAAEQKAADRAAAQERKRAGSEALRTIKTYADERAALSQLVSEYGRFNLALQVTGKAQSEVERRARAIIDANEDLSRELGRIGDAAPGSTVQLSRANLYQRPRVERPPEPLLNPFQIRELAREFDNLGIRGLSSFGTLFSILGPIGIAIAGIGLATGGVIAGFIKLGQVGAKALSDLIKDGEKAATEIDAIEASFRGIFDGDENIAESVVNVLRDKSKQLGIDIQSIVRQVLPLSKSLEQGIQLSEFAVGLARRDPKVGEEGATRAIQAATAGNLEPLRRTFDLDVSRIRDAQKEFGLLEGLIAGLGPILTELGLDIDSQAGTFATQSGRMKQAYQEFLQVLGTPIIEEKTRQLVSLNQQLEEGNQSSTRIAASIGAAASEVVESIGAVIARVLETLDEEKIVKITNKIVELGERISVLFDLVTSNIGETDGAVVKVATGFNFLNGTLKIVQSNVAFTKALFAAVKSEMFDVLVLMKEFATLDFGGLAQTLVAMGAGGGFVEAFNRELEKNVDIIREQESRILEAQQANEAYIQSALNANEADLARADAILAENARLRELADAAEAAAEAQAELDEARLEYDIDRGRAYDDLVKDQTREALDLEEEFARDREELYIKNHQDILNAERDFRSSLAKAARDFSRAEEDAILKAARKRTDVEREVADKRAEIELDYQRKIAELRRKFDFDAEEAIRNNDAVAYLRLRRQLNANLDEARIKRDENLADARSSAEKVREAERRALEQSIEDARTANSRKLEDLRLAYEEQIAEIDIRHQQEIEKQTRLEEAKREEQAKTFARAREDFDLYWQRRLADIERQYQKELEIVRRYEALIAQTQAQAQSRRRYTAQYASNPGDLDRLPPPPRGTQLPSGGGGGTGASYARQFGGAAPVGAYTLVGERGPELVRFKSPAHIYPAGATRQIINNYRNSESNTLNLAPGMEGFTPAQIDMVRTILVSMLRSI